ncbi:hypothetical protein DMH88_05350 [Escherichia coli]|nr:hypothetical protein [Escherichia coli]
MPACCFIPYSAKRICGINVAPCAFYRLSNVKAPQRVAGFHPLPGRENLFSFDADKFAFSGL